MTRQPVSSSMILGIGYDPETQTLEIQFSNGVVWQYANVPEDVWEDFENSSSVGRYFLQNIKGQYSESIA